MKGQTKMTNLNNLGDWDTEVDKAWESIIKVSENRWLTCSESNTLYRVWHKIDAKLGKNESISLKECSVHNCGKPYVDMVKKNRAMQIGLAGAVLVFAFPFLPKGCNNNAPLPVVDEPIPVVQTLKKGEKFSPCPTARFVDGRELT